MGYNDLSSQRFGMLVVLHRDLSKYYERPHYVCRCDCGTEKVVTSTSLTRKLRPTHSCGCRKFGGDPSQFGSSIKKKRQELGSTSNRLTLIEHRKEHIGKRGNYGLYRCECGNEKVLSKCAVLNKKNPIRSCGCLQKDSTTLERGVAAFNIKLKSYIKQAADRGLAFELTPDEFREITQRDCYYCGEKPSNVCRSKNGNGTFVYNGVDRVDNAIGYKLANCVACCAWCNVAKRDKSSDEFIEHCVRVANNNLAKLTLQRIKDLDDTHNGEKKDETN